MRKMLTDDENINMCGKKYCDSNVPKPHCRDWCGANLGYNWGWLASLILWFIIFVVLWWLIFYSLKPYFVLENDSNQVDPAKVLLAAVIASIILVVVLWLIKLVMMKL